MKPSTITRSMWVGALLTWAAWSHVGHAQAGTLQTVQARGELRCGVSDVPDGSLVKPEDGGIVGFHTELCRALAAAVLGTQEAVLYVPLSTSEQFTALQQGEIDILVGSVSVTSGRDATLTFGPVTFHEGAQHYAPVLRQGDDAWRDVVSWVFYALLQAEEWGITSQNVGLVGDAAQAAQLQRFLGFESDLVTDLGLEPHALRRTVEQVGNYGELYDRHLGPGATVSLERGLNRLWTEGGLLYAPPFSPE